MFGFADADHSGTVQFDELLAVLSRAELNFSQEKRQRNALPSHQGAGAPRHGFGTGVCACGCVGLGGSEASAG